MPGSSKTNRSSSGSTTSGNGCACMTSHPAAVHKGPRPVLRCPTAPPAMGMVPVDQVQLSKAASPLCRTRPTAVTDPSTTRTLADTGATSRPGRSLEVPPRRTWPEIESKSLPPSSSKYANSLHYHLSSILRTLLIISLCVALCSAAKSGSKSSAKRKGNSKGDPGSADGTDEHGVRLPSRCETCRHVVQELEMRLAETGSTHDVVETTKKVNKYHSSELRLIETLEDLCERFLKYDVHKEYSDSRRFARGRSRTMHTLEGLMAKGVDVQMGVPYELWTNPSVEVTALKRGCENLLEEQDEAIEQWYYNAYVVPGKQQSGKAAGARTDVAAGSIPERGITPFKGLMEFLCTDRVLKGDDQECLSDPTERDEKDEL